MRIRFAALAILFALNSTAVVNAQPTPSALKPVHKTLTATCIGAFHAEPQTYDNLDKTARYTCSSPPPVCAANMAVWWTEPPSVTPDARFRYSCKLVQGSTTPSAVCAAGYTTGYFRTAPAGDANVKYACSTAPVACPIGFNVNQNDPDFYGFKSGVFLYKCARAI